MNGALILSTAAMALLTLEVIKVIVRKIASDPDLSLPQIIYDLGMPLLVAAWGLIFSLVPSLGFPVPDELISPTGLLQWFLAVLVQLVFYFNAVKPFKDGRNS
jgi:hypothetical protein